MKKEFAKLVNFTGRKNEIERFKNKFNDFSIFFIYGMRGIGKTSFIIKALNVFLCDDRKSDIFYVKGERGYKLKDIVGYMNSNYNFNLKENISLELFLEHIENENIILIIDNFSFCDIDHSLFIKKAFEIFLGSKLIIISCQLIDIPLLIKSDIYEYYVEKLDYVEFKILLNKILLAHNNSKISSIWYDKIYKKTAGIPLYIKIFASLFTSCSCSFVEIFEENAFGKTLEKEIDYLDYSGLTPNRKNIMSVLSFFNSEVDENALCDFFDFKIEDISFLKSSFVIEYYVDKKIKISEPIKILLNNNVEKEQMKKTVKKILEFYEQRFELKSSNFFDFIRFSFLIENKKSCFYYIKDSFNKFPVDFVLNRYLCEFLEENIEELLEYNKDVVYYLMCIQAFKKDKKTVFIENLNRIEDEHKRNFLINIFEFVKDNKNLRDIGSLKTEISQKILIDFVIIKKARANCHLQKCISDITGFIENYKAYLSENIVVELKVLMSECYLFLMEHDKCQTILTDLLEKYPYYENCILADIYFLLAIVEVSKKAKKKAYEYYRQFIYYSNSGKENTIFKRIVYVILYLRVFQKISSFGITGETLEKKENSNGFYSLLLSQIYIFRHDYYKACEKFENGLKYLKENNHLLYYNLFFIDYAVLKFITEKNADRIKTELNDLNISHWDYMQALSDGFLCIIENKDYGDIIRELSFYKSVVLERELNRIREILDKNKSDILFNVNINGIKRKVEYYEMMDFNRKKESYNIFIDFVNQEMFISGKQQDIFKKNTLLRLLKVFCGTMGQDMSSEDIFEMVWGRKLEDPADINLLRVSIHSLRKIFQDMLVNTRKSKTYMLELKNDFCIIME